MKLNENNLLIALFIYLSNDTKSIFLLTSRSTIHENTLKCIEFSEGAE